VVVDPDPAGAIHEALRRNRTAIACMATHGRGRSAALVGSVATEVVARGHDPLVLVGPLVGDRVRGEGVGVVTCLDGTPASTGIATLGLGWARLVVEPLVLLTVAEPVPPPVREGAPYRRFGPDDPDAFLKEVAADLPGDAPVDTVAVFDPISPAEGVRSYLRDNPAYLVMVASHARTGVALLVFGSTAGNVVHHSRSPVLVIPRQSASGLEGGQR
jgi:nucleotide-binding universal stress UspA family protein